MVFHSQQDDPKSFFLDNKILGIEMEAEIKNLSHPIKIRYNNVDKVKEMS